MRYFFSCAQALLCFATVNTHTDASAEDAQDHSGAIARRLIVAHLQEEALPGEMDGYLLLEDGRWISRKGVVLRQKKTADEDSSTIWTTYISAEVGEIEELVLRGELVEGNSKLYQVFGSSIFISPIEEAEVVRKRIALLRQQLEQLQDERERLTRSYETLKRDAHLIGQQDTIEKLERDVRETEKNISRIRAQTKDFRNEIRSLKAWPEPLDIRERKQAYLKDLRELQEKSQHQ